MTTVILATRVSSQDKSAETTGLSHNFIEDEMGQTRADEQVILFARKAQRSRSKTGFRTSAVRMPEGPSGLL